MKPAVNSVKMLFGVLREGLNVSWVTAFKIGEGFWSYKISCWAASVLDFKVTLI